jgi:hypothetical protein
MDEVPHPALFLILGAGVTPAEGGVEATWVPHFKSLFSPSYCAAIFRKDMIFLEISPRRVGVPQE